MQTKDEKKMNRHKDIEVLCFISWWCCKATTFRLKFMRRCTLSSAYFTEEWTKKRSNCILIVVMKSKLGRECEKIAETKFAKWKRNIQIAIHFALDTFFSCCFSAPIPIKSNAWQTLPLNIIVVTILKIKYIFNRTMKTIWSQRLVTNDKSIRVTTAIENIVNFIEQTNQITKFLMKKIYGTKNIDRCSTNWLILTSIEVWQNHIYTSQLVISFVMATVTKHLNEFEIIFQTMLLPCTIPIVHSDCL